METQKGRCTDAREQNSQDVADAGLVPVFDRRETVSRIAEPTVQLKHDNSGCSRIAGALITYTSKCDTSLACDQGRTSTTRRL